MTDDAGYSGKPLSVKLGIKPGHRVYVDAPPAGFVLGEPAGTTVLHRLPVRPVDVVLTFCPERSRLDRRLETMLARIAVSGAVWVCWPKRSSGIDTDLDENVVRKVGLDLGVVDVKVCAVDETWSGLKFVRRLTDR